MMKKKILVIDVGNTSTSLGVYARGRIVKADRLDTAVRGPRIIRNRLVRLLGKTAPTGVSFASVVPELNGLWTRAVRALWPGVRIVRVHHRLKLGVKLTYPKPTTIGADRLANACGASHRYGTPVIVADFGTAVTFDIITRKEGYVGGVIAPGLPLMFSYLAEKTAQLPFIGPGPVKNAVGKSTTEAMRMGAIWGYRGLVREILKELKHNLAEKNIRLCATGGYAGWVLKGAGIPMRLDPTLTLYGLGRIFELNP